jgi:SAM-dependent methyltransferase
MTAFDDHERRRWAGRAAAYQGSFAALCAHTADALLDAAGVAEGVRLLDIGTGPGTVAALACARAAEVVAVDAEPSMLEPARRRAPAADVRHGALPQLPFGDRVFGAAVANFVLNHVGDPGAAIAEMRRVVRPGGRIAVTIWPVPAPPAQQLWNRIFDDAGVERPADLPRVAPDKDFPRTRDGLSGLLRRAGLAGVRCDPIVWTHRTDPEAWWSGAANGISTAGLLLQRQDPATADRVRRHYDRHTAAYREPDGRLALPTAALLASATVS